MPKGITGLGVKTAMSGNEGEEVIPRGHNLGHQKKRQKSGKNKRGRGYPL